MRGLGFAVLSLLLANMAVASTAVVEFSDESLRIRYQQLVQELRCPKCQNQNLADSNSPISEDLRAQVHRLLEEGMSDREIKNYLKSRYSEFILYRPEVNQNTWLLWAAPVVFLLFGLWVLYRLYFNRSSSDMPMEQNDQLSSVDQQRLDQLLRNKDKQ
ncbi:MAG: cytochrome c-type biogenesis protein CcmH [Porticoccaceae bacterium]|jgi:cytochrome c-type biogenesis protein CcmH|nr:cytochrome c-type biogenesis protein CcmH [Porticoccaceae bacterium]